MFFDVSEKDLKLCSSELLSCVGEAELKKIISNVGLLPEEETIMIRHYGVERATVPVICKDLCISESTYKRYRRSCITKIIRYLRQDGVLTDEK